MDKDEKAGEHRAQVIVQHEEGQGMYSGSRASRRKPGDGEGKEEEQLLITTMIQALYSHV